MDYGFAAPGPPVHPVILSTIGYGPSDSDGGLMLSNVNSISVTAS